MLTKVLPRRLLAWLLRIPFIWYLLGRYYHWFGRPCRQAETSKARPRREREGFFDAYCQGYGLDIGYGGDLLTENCRCWDFEDGDAQTLAGVGDENCDFVYSSHTLEHMRDPTRALVNWWRVLRPGGHLILYLPHRDLYEKKQHLPSRWNLDHKHFFMPEKDEPPDTIGLLQLLETILPDGEIVALKECSEGYTIDDPLLHSNGEYSIEAVVRKRL